MKKYNNLEFDRRKIYGFGKKKILDLPFGKYNKYDLDRNEIMNATLGICEMGKRDSYIVDEKKSDNCKTGIYKF